MAPSELRRQLSGQLDRAARHRWLLIVGWLGAIAALSSSNSGDGDWEFFRRGTRALLGHAVYGRPGGVHLYASMPSIQIGPPALIVALPFDALPRPWDVNSARAVMVALMLLMLWLIERTCESLGVSAGHRARGVLIGGFVLAPAWLSVAVDYTHLDDVIVLVLSSVASLLVARDRPLWAAAVVGVIAATKPWGVVVAPILFQFEWRRALPAAVLAAAVAALWWLPFLLDPRTVVALSQFRLSVSGSSGLRLLGAGNGPMPIWTRPAQFVGGVTLGTVAVRRGHWTGVLAVGFATRVALDPESSHYYDVAPLVGALLFDVSRSKSGVPWTTIFALAGLTSGAVVSQPIAVAGIRVATCAAVTASVLLRRRASVDAGQPPVLERTDLLTV